MKKNLIFYKILFFMQNQIKKIFNLILSILFIPLVILLRILRPLVLVKIGYINSEHIGHLVFETAYYSILQSIEKKKIYRIFYFRNYDKIANKYWIQYAKRYIFINNFLYYLYLSNSLIPGSQEHIIEQQKNNRDLEGLLQKNKIFNFSLQENTKAKKFLSSIGLKENEKFICLNIRDSYYNNKYKKWNNNSWDYHSYRNSNINNFVKVIKKLNDMNYWVIRVGKGTEKKIELNSLKYFDYANSKYRSDFLDIWLMANCFFSINSSRNGLDEVSRVFKVPTVGLNSIPIHNIDTYEHSIEVPKELFWKTNQIKLTLSEYLKYNFGRTQEFENAGIIFKELNSEDIIDCVIEMEKRLKGEWKESEEDIELQNQFFSIFKKFDNYSLLHNIIDSNYRIGSKYLKKNILWLK